MSFDLVRVTTLCRYPVRLQTATTARGNSRDQHRCPASAPRRRQRSPASVRTLPDPLLTSLGSPPPPTHPHMESMVRISACVITSLMVFILLTTTTYKHAGKLHDHGTLSIYVAEVPDTYIVGTTGRGVEETNLRYGHTSLGPLFSVEHEQWGSSWHALIAWFIDQINTSPLRTYDPDAADIIFVPAILNFLDPGSHDRFIDEAPQFLPYLTIKPHLMVLNHPPGLYTSSLLRHNNSEHFVFVSWGQMTGWQSANVVGCPAFSFVHWSRGSKPLRTEERLFDAEATERSKTLLVAESFLVREPFPDRFTVYEDCIGAPDNCTHVEWTAHTDAVAVYEAMQSAWYVMHPEGDFLTRNSLCDTLLADAVPVLFQAEYIDSVPFTDILDWDKIVLFIPESEVLGDNRTNVIHRLAREFDKDEALSRIEYIHSIRHIFQYMQNPDHELIRWDQRSTIQPDDDAFTSTMKAVMRYLCGRGMRTEKCSVSLTASWLRRGM